MPAPPAPESRFTLEDLRPAPPVRSSVRLRYTGVLDHDAFESRCADVGHWYHTYLFDNGFEVRGDYDVAADVEDFGFPDDMSGMQVLDIGAGAGWYSHFFAQRGASVTAIDARGYGDFDVYGRIGYVDEAGARAPDTYEDAPDGSRRPLYFSPVSGAMWVMRGILRAPIEMYNARVYDVGPNLFMGKTFDLIFMGALLIHLRDPIGALMAARSVCRGELIASTRLIDDEDATPIQIMPFTHIDRISWFMPNSAAYRQWFLAAGFGSVDISRTTHLRIDKPHLEDGRLSNQNQELRIARARV